MALNVQHFDLVKRDCESTYGTIVEILLKSRLAMHLETNQGFYDEDVNAYLAGVLCEYLDPGYQTAVRDCLSSHDADVFASATRDDDTYRMYWVYKVNADDRLVDVGIFHPQRATQMTLVEQAKTYYGFASGYHQRVYGRVTATGDILEKLARWGERYVSILHQARRDYLHFVETLTEEELQQFHRSLEQEATATALKRTQDEFLDAYSAWQQTPTPECRAHLLQLLGELQRLDPMFLGHGFLKPTE